MNAILRDDCEAIVLTNEAIEVHLSYLRPAVEALDDKLDALNKKLDDKLDDKLDATDKKPDSKLENVDDKLGELNNKVDQRDKEHTERFSSIQASLDGLKWFVSSAAVLASGASIAHSLGWI